QRGDQRRGDLGVVSPLGPVVVSGPESMKRMRQNGPHRQQSVAVRVATHHATSVSAPHRLCPTWDRTWTGHTGPTDLEDNSDIARAVAGRGHPGRRREG